jgi:electron transfer flavoprotein alpha subunit
MDSERDRNKKILVLVETEDLEVDSTTFELLGMGRKIATELNGIVSGVVLGQGISKVEDGILPFAEEVYSISHFLLETFNAELYASALKQLCQKVNPEAVLMGCSLNHLDLAPRLAYKMNVPLVTDCVDLAIEPETGCLLCTKPIYGAKVISTFKLIKKPYIATLRRKTAEPARRANTKGNIIRFTPVLDQVSVRVKLIERVKEESTRLDKAKVIVAGGRGIKDSGGLGKLKELMEALKKYFESVELGASRPLVDLHLVPSSRQIGLTGEKVAPELYIAVGISGSLQHLTGILGAKKIIAINNSPKAPIFEAADYGVVGDFEEIVPALKRKLEEFQ